MICWVKVGKTLLYEKMRRFTFVYLQLEFLPAFALLNSPQVYLSDCLNKSLLNKSILHSLIVKRSVCI